MKGKDPMGAHPSARHTMPQKPVLRRLCLSGMGQGAGLQKPCDRRSARSRHDVALSEAGAMPCGQAGQSEDRHTFSSLTLLTVSVTAAQMCTCCA